MSINGKGYSLGAQAMKPILDQFLPHYNSIVIRMGFDGYLIAAEIKPDIIIIGEASNERF